MTPVLYSLCFKGTGPHASSYQRFAAVLAHTAAVHCPDWERHVDTIDPTGLYDHTMHGFASNTEKLDWWVRFAKAQPDGTPVLLMDADMAILRPLDDLWSREFDIAYTTRAGRFPFNGGVVALRVSEPVRTFLTDWQTLNNHFLGHPLAHRPYRNKFGGINQASFGALLPEAGRRGLAIRTLPGKDWNIEQTYWRSYDHETARILHVKSHLRHLILGRPCSMPGLEPLAKLWYTLERAATSSPSSVGQTPGVPPCPSVPLPHRKSQQSPQRARSRAAIHQKRRAKRLAQTRPPSA